MTLEGMLFREIPNHQIIEYHDFTSLIPEIISLNFYRKSSNIYIEMMGLRHYKGNSYPTKTSIYSVKLPLEMSDEQLAWFTEPLHLAIKKYNKELKDEKEKKLLDDPV